jgi:hypothetical protein
MCKLKTSCKPLLLKGEGGNPLVEVTLNSKDENCVQEFGLGVYDLSSVIQHPPYSYSTVRTVYSTYVYTIEKFV